MRRNSLMWILIGCLAAILVPSSASTDPMVPPEIPGLSLILAGVFAALMATLGARRIANVFLSAGDLFRPRSADHARPIARPSDCVHSIFRRWTLDPPLTQPSLWCLRLHRSLCVLIGLAALGLAPRAEAAVSFTPLGDLPGGNFYSYAWGVSADGTKVVGWGLSASDLEAVTWDATNGMVSLGPFATENFPWSASAVSADGITVAGRGSSDSGTEAFIWDATNGMISLGDLAGGSFFSEAFGISADGVTVVGRSNSESGREAFIWDATNGMVGLGDFAGGVFSSEAWGVSADGTTVVGGATSGSGQEAFRWDATNGMVGLGTFTDGYSYSVAKAVSADGTRIVGGVGSSVHQAFIWDAINGIVPIGDLAGGSVFSEALGVSADGTTVVGWGTSDNSDLEAFIWDATNGMRELDAVLASGGVDLTGWVLSQATGISADGLTIVGYGTNPSGFFEAWIAVIADPASVPIGPGVGGLTMLLLATGGVLKLRSLPRSRDRRSRALRLIH